MGGLLKFLTTPRAIFNELSDIYVNDEDFIQAFKKARIVTKNRKKIVRYILFKIENSLRFTELDWESNNGTIEHILPENPSERWTEVIANEDHEEYIYRLGNYALLSPSDNRRVGNDLLSTKRNIYQSSDYQLSSEISHEIWNKESIKIRQQVLAKRASLLWKSDYLV
jgi:NADH dehydrogenase/NADH:ubiquinone oxidoreductase subunit G